MLERFLPAHTKLRSSIDTLAYRGGAIEARIALHPDHQAEFEKEVEGLKLRFETAVKTAHDTYERDLRALFIAFGKIEAEPPVVLTQVVPKQEYENGAQAHA